MRKKTFFTEPINCDVPEPMPELSTVETEFEKKRGVGNIEVRRGFAQVHVSNLEGDLVQERLRVLKAVADADVNIDFLKLTPSGLSFLALEDRAETVKAVLKGEKVDFIAQKSRSIVLVHAVNMRDEEGLIASIVQAAIASRAIVDHIGDMHDRLLMVLDSADAERLAAKLRKDLVE